MERRREDGWKGGGTTLGEPRGVNKDSVLGGGVGRGGNLASGGDDTKGETGIPGNWDSGGDVEGCGSDSTSPAHSLHHLTRLPT